MSTSEGMSGNSFVATELIQIFSAYVIIESSVLVLAGIEFVSLIEAKEG